jgi:hypothetical protein
MKLGKNTTPTKPFTMSSMFASQLSEIREKLLVVLARLELSHDWFPASIHLSKFASPIFPSHDLANAILPMIDISPEDPPTDRQQHRDNQNREHHRAPPSRLADDKTSCQNSSIEEQERLLYYT